MSAKDSGGKCPYCLAHTAHHSYAFTPRVELTVFPKPQGRTHNLHAEGLYMPVYLYLRHCWKDSVQLIPDTSFAEDGSPFIAMQVPFYTHVTIAGQKYGASSTHRGLRNRYAYIDGRQAVSIVHIMRCRHTTEDGRTLAADLAIVKPFLRSPEAPNLPWASRYVVVLWLIHRRVQLTL